MDYHMMGGFRVVFVALLGCWFGVFFLFIIMVLQCDVLSFPCTFRKIPLFAVIDLTSSLYPMI